MLKAWSLTQQASRFGTPTFAQRGDPEFPRGLQAGPERLSRHKQAHRRRFRDDSDNGGPLLCRDVVAVVQSTEPGRGNHSARWAGTSDGPAVRRSLLRQSKMRPVVMIVMDVLGHQPFEMPLVQHDHMIEQVSAATTYEAFCHSVLPWAAEAGPVSRQNSIRSEKHGVWHKEVSV